MSHPVSVGSPALNRASAPLGGARWARLFAAGSFFLGLVSLAPSARAREQYPTIVERELGMPCTPECTLCHTVNPGVAFTAERDFVRLVVPVSDEMLAASLQGLVEEDHEAVHALREGRDPNDPDSEEGAICKLDVRYGCGARVEPRGALGIGAAGTFAIALLGIAWWRRRMWMRSRASS